MYDEIKISELHFTVPQARSGGKPGLHLYINVDNQNKRNLYYQGPKCHVPFAVNPDETPNRESSYESSMMCNIDDNELLQKLNELDATVLATAIANKDTWFPSKEGGKSIKTDDWIKSKQFCVVKVSEDNKYKPKMKLKIINQGNKGETSFYTSRKVDGKNLMRPATIDAISAGCHVVPIITLAGAWIGTLGYGVELRVDQLMIEQSEDVRGVHNFVLDGEIMLDSNPVIEHEIISNIEYPKKRELDDLEPTCDSKRLHTDN